MLSTTTVLQPLTPRAGTRRQNPRRDLRCQPISLIRHNNAATNSWQLQSVTAGNATMSAYMRVASDSTKAPDSVGVKNRQNRRSLLLMPVPSNLTELRSHIAARHPRTTMQASPKSACSQFGVSDHPEDTHGVAPRLHHRISTPSR